MGYRPKEKTYRLVFADPEFDGLEVVMGSVTVDEFIDMTRVAATAAEDAEQAGKLFDSFAASLQTWNVEDTHGPVPATLEGVGTQRLDFIMTIFRAWQEAQAGVPPPSNEDSPSGETSLERSLQLARASTSRAS